VFSHYERDNFARNNLEFYKFPTISAKFPCSKQAVKKKGEVELSRNIAKVIPLLIIGILLFAGSVFLLLNSYSMGYAGLFVQLFGSLVILIIVVGAILFGRTQSSKEKVNTNKKLRKVGKIIGCMVLSSIVIYLFVIPCVQDIVGGSVTERVEVLNVNRETHRREYDFRFINAVSIDTGDKLRFRIGQAENIDKLKSVLRSPSRFSGDSYYIGKYKVYMDDDIRKVYMVVTYYPNTMIHSEISDITIEGE
jgi:uncharacterized membrane protein SirB2